MKTALEAVSSRTTVLLGLVILFGTPYLLEAYCFGKCCYRYSYHVVY